ncbi:N-acetyl-gamma-glutamyl-phosphate reductase [Oceanicola sp. 22II-s10i]|uniref:N-acetyl-gamma-glutamyl-phosphate reductase n=1 Tax=Oceanicola sp. 22II-s10i TaxID=1317116 RepID=UPI000B51F694|nr:N-acetyl-gamma-glutamyl-phosphate reductase [Oceanicola sp. 22II-s10i]OWU84902.1 N-acetyl-gamma-glutamyl-phosphate reductase [Oceanicola sp. 22II-s10i]
MAYKIFIDGEVGTTGLQIRERLDARADIELLSLSEDRRKDVNARADAAREADVSILCLPDAAAKDLVAALGPDEGRLIDASTAHRVDPDWVFGFPEMAEGQRQALSSARRVSNPGCWSTCAIALIRPMVEAGLMAPDAAHAVSGVSGYTGGGKAMIAEFETGEAEGSFLYGVSQAHKHLPEMTKYGKLTVAPVFVPSVGAYAQGMAVAVHLGEMGPDGMTAAKDALSAAYEGQQFVSVVDASVHEPRVLPQRLNGTNRLELSVHGNPATGAVTLIAVLDNLGKGASGAAVQNMNLMLGAEESAGLV